MIQFYHTAKNRKTISPVDRLSCGSQIMIFFKLEDWNTTPMNGFVICRRKTYATTESNDGDIFSAYRFLFFFFSGRRFHFIGYLYPKICVSYFIAFIF